ncbi:uncharacterized protein DS421_3g81260 [Arachis hypogaea]|nr:uncharacterized protein DS421_3g81260 [Arachis hypogaea]
MHQEARFLVISETALDFILCHPFLSLRQLSKGYLKEKKDKYSTGCLLLIEILVNTFPFTFSLFFGEEKDIGHKAGRHVDVHYFLKIFSCIANYDLINVKADILLAIGVPPHTSQGTAFTFPLFLLFEAPPSSCPPPPKVVTSPLRCPAFTSSSQLSLEVNEDSFSCTKNTSNKMCSGVKRAILVESSGKATSSCARWETPPRKQWPTTTASERDDAYTASSRSSIMARSQECSRITRSVVTTVSSLQSDVRHLIDTFDR